jgi:hypothetical protein
VRFPPGARRSAAEIVEFWNDVAWEAKLGRGELVAADAASAGVIAVSARVPVMATANFENFRANAPEENSVENSSRKWRVFYVSDEHFATVTADRFEETGEWIDFLDEDGTIVRRERAAGVARITAKRLRKDTP